MGIFKAYDIRGIYPADLDERTAHDVGRAMVVYLKAKSLLVAHDCRQSSPSLTKALIEGITEQGADVVDAGLSSSPMFNFCVGTSDVDGGVMVTASHNPKEYNGFKLDRRGAIALSGDAGIKDVEQIVLKKLFPRPKGKGMIVKRDLIGAYADHVLSFAGDLKPLKVVFDAGNGMGGLVAPPVFSKTPISLIPMWFELDGCFPNRSPDPSKEENVAQLCARVVKEKADLGIAFDGDGDRVVFVDECGKVVRSDLATGLIAQEIASRNPDAAVLYDVRSSRAVRERLEELGLEYDRTRVGHAFIKAAMREHNAAFAGEMSGHFYFRENFYCDSAMVASMFMLSLLSRSGRKLSDLAAPLRKYPSTGEVNFIVKDAKALFAEVKSEFSDASIDELDGVTVEYDDWWVNLRSSNTEPLVRMNLEGKDAPTLKKARSRVESIILRFGAPEERKR